MRVGLDFRPAMQARTGIGRYVAGLAPELARLCDLQLYGYFRKGNTKAVRRAPAAAALHARAVPFRLMCRLARYRLLSTERAVGGCDLFQHTTFQMAPVRKPQVFMMHDLAFLRRPEWYSPRARRALEYIARLAADRCAALLAPSEASARDCREILGFDRVFVTPLGVDERFFGLKATRPERPYVLAVGTREPRKNYPRLIRACRGLAVDLRIVGPPGWLSDEVVASEQVILEDRVSEERLLALMAGASAVAYPSLFEGFGLPVVEAMAAGKPLLTSDREPMRTIAGAAALLVDPEDEDAIAAGLMRLLADDELRARLARAGPERARAFTWKACALATRAAYDAVLS